MSKPWVPQRPVAKNRHQFLRRNYFELSVGAVARFFVGAPPSKLGHVTEAGALHVFIGNFNYKFGAQWLPRQILTLTPAALPSRHSLPGFTGCRFMFSPAFPRMVSKGVFPIRCKELHKLLALLFREAATHAYVL